MLLVVMALFLYVGTGIGYGLLKLQLIRMRPAPATAKVEIPAAETLLREPAEGYRIVTERNLFGTTTKTIADKQAGPATPDIATLVDLKGTVAGDPPYGFAIIEERATRKQRLVKVGAVFAGAKVVRIRRNALDLTIGDQERTLKIAETKEAPILPPAAAEAAPPVTTAGGAIVLARSELGTALQNMGTMLRQAQVRPFFNAGSPDGFMITGIQAGSLYQKMGIVDGDIIQGVDNRTIRTADDMMALFNTLKNAPAMSLTVRRTGKQETLKYQFR